MTKRAIVLLLDSFGIGAADDAAQYRDENSNTLYHIANYCAHQKGRKGFLKLPNLAKLGLVATAQEAKNISIPINSDNPPIIGKYGYAQEISHGKDTPSGHWEIAGAPVLFDWGYFPNDPSFPDELINQLIYQANLPGILGNCHASGTEIIARLGAQHIKTKKPIIYTSADSVFQIAAHESEFGLERLYQVCEIARKLVDPYRVGRVIARPFVGTEGKFARTHHRRDYTMPPPYPTLLDKLFENNIDVVAIGKIADIFANRGITQKIVAADTMQLFDATLEALKKTTKATTLIFANFTDFDTLYGHRRDVIGYAAALEAFDLRLPELEKLLNPDDLVIITADHGCDPTFRGTDHTREYIPILMFGPKISPENIGKRKTFADIGQTLAQYMQISALEFGQSFL